MSFANCPLFLRVLATDFHTGQHHVPVHNAHTERDEPVTTSGLIDLDWLHSGPKGRLSESFVKGSASRPDNAPLPLSLPRNSPRSSATANSTKHHQFATLACLA